LEKLNWVSKVKNSPSLNLEFIDDIKTEINLIKEKYIK
jgi:hypothetical protein